LENSSGSGSPKKVMSGFMTPQDQLTGAAWWWWWEEAWSYSESELLS
jgi:hypothetical protein